MPRLLLFSELELFDLLSCYFTVAVVRCSILYLFLLWHYFDNEWDLLSILGEFTTNYTFSKKVYLTLYSILITFIFSLFYPLFPLYSRPFSSSSTSHYISSNVFSFIFLFFIYFKGILVHVASYSIFKAVAYVWPSSN